MTSTKGEHICTVDKIIWAIGRAPTSDVLNLGSTDIKFNPNNKRIEVF
jgi:pyruvate/2-oxoglutarate dehydrogenase complex dihydrolipoamide dehydrogenase (E3) component